MIDNSIEDQTFNELQVNKLKGTDTVEILSISLEKGAIFPEHTSPKDAILVMLQGEIIFHINNEDTFLKQHQKLGFSKEVTHWVEALENAKFLILR